MREFAIWVMVGVALIEFLGAVVAEYRGRQDKVVSCMLIAILATLILIALKL